MIILNTTINKYYNIIINTDEYKNIYIDKHIIYDYDKIVNIGQSIFIIIKYLYNNNLLKNIKKNHIEELLKLLLSNLLGNTNDIDIAIMYIMMCNNWYDSKYNVYYD
jgi:hypothetical protein